MIGKMWNFIRKTNGDALGAPLFICLIIYLVLIDQKEWYEWALLVGCVGAFIVDTKVVLETYLPKRRSRRKIE